MFDLQHSMSPVFIKLYVVHLALLYTLKFLFIYKITWYNYKLIWVQSFVARVDLIYGMITRIYRMKNHTRCVSLNKNWNWIFCCCCCCYCYLYAHVWSQLFGGLMQIACDCHNDIEHEHVAVKKGRTKCLPLNTKKKLITKYISMEPHTTKHNRHNLMNDWIDLIVNDNKMLLSSMVLKLHIKCEIQLRFEWGCPWKFLPFDGENAALATISLTLSLYRSIARAASAAAW